MPPSAVCRSSGVKPRTSSGRRRCPASDGRRRPSPNGRVWLTTVVETKERRGRVSASLRALAFDVATGRELVNVEVFRLDDAGYVNPKNSRASPTPIVDGDRVYVHFGADGHSGAQHVRRDSLDDAPAL